MNAMPHPNPALYLSPEMVNELALGMDNPYDIAARYGMAQYEFDHLQAQEWFGRLVAERRVVLHDEGVTFPLKAKMMAEEMYQDIFKSFKAGQLTGALALDMVKQLAAIAWPKEQGFAPQGSGGPQFQINIKIGETSPPAPHREPAPDKAQVIEAKPLVSIPFGPDPLPPRPLGFKLPDFKLTSDLVGTPMDRTISQGVPA